MNITSAGYNTTNRQTQQSFGMKPSSAAKIVHESACEVRDEFQRTLTHLACSLLDSKDKDKTFLGETLANHIMYGMDESITRLRKGYLQKTDRVNGLIDQMATAIRKPWGETVPAVKAENLSRHDAVARLGGIIADQIEGKIDPRIDKETERHFQGFIDDQPELDIKENE